MEGAFLVLFVFSSLSFCTLGAIHEEFGKHLNGVSTLASLLNDDATRDYFIDSISVPLRSGAEYSYSDAHGCKECIRGVTFHIINETEHMIKEFCNKSKCPLVMHICKAAEEHKDVLTGFVMAKVHPRSLAASYCFGKGVCEHPNDNDVSMEIPDMEAEPVPFLALPKMTGNEFAVDSLAFDILPLEPDELQQSISEEMNKECFSAFDDSMSSFEKGGNVAKWTHCRCMGCVCGVSKMVMVYKINRVLSWCLDNKHNPRAQKICEAAYKSPGVAFGFVLGMVDPWKYALGFCTANHHCHRSVSNLSTVDLTRLPQVPLPPVPLLPYGEPSIANLPDYSLHRLERMRQSASRRESHEVSAEM